MMRMVSGAALMIVLALPASAQDRWSWPERAENLQQLPADFPGQRLRAVMSGFTRALGVRCSHCHVGEEGQPLSTYDFASDDNPKKIVARQMLAMLGEISGRLKEIEPGGPRRVNMWCHTCHSGRPRPHTLSDELREVYDANGLEAAVARYRELRDRYYGRAAYDFSETSLNSFGYQLLGGGDAAGAIAMFRLNAEFHAESANVWDSLAEAYMENGQPELARALYQKSLTLDPENGNAVEKLKQLGVGGAADDPGK